MVSADLWYEDAVRIDVAEDWDTGRLELRSGI
jgi:hypothetical protein